MMTKIFGVMVTVVMLGLGLLGTVPVVLAGPGQCPVFNAADVDNFAIAAGIAPLAEADLQELVCEDDPTIPRTRILARISPQTVLSGIAGPVIPDETDWIAQMSCSLNGTSCGFLGSAGPFTVGEEHICRAEILRSFTWRRLCAKKVDRRPAQ